MSLPTMLDNNMADALLAALQHRFEDECQKLINETVEKAEASLARILAQTSIEIFKHVRFESYGRELAIIVKMEKK